MESCSRIASRRATIPPCGANARRNARATTETSFESNLERLERSESADSISTGGSPCEALMATNAECTAPAEQSAEHAVSCLEAERRASRAMRRVSSGSAAFCRVAARLAASSFDL
eukprot:scaffold106646_cov31-Tisochrysis_lutea.AAC.1